MKAHDAQSPPWRVVWALSVTQVISWGSLFYAISVLMAPIERELGWKPAETFETGIRKTVQWYLDNSDWVAGVQSGAYREWVNHQYGA